MTHEEATDGVHARSADIISDGTRIQAEVFVDGSFDEQRPTIVMSHGWGGTADLLRPDARAFARAGFLVVTIDYRGWGKSDARMVAIPQSQQRESAAGETLVELRGVVDPIDQTTDLLNTLHWLEAEPLCDTQRIGLWGSSFSGGHVVYVAARDRRVKAFVSQVPSLDNTWITKDARVCAYASERATSRARGEIGYPEAFADFHGMQGRPIWEKLIHYAPIEDISRCESCAKLFIVAENEELFSNELNAVAAFERANGTKRLVSLPGITHYGIYEMKRKEAQRLAIDWFGQHL